MLLWCVMFGFKESSRLLKNEITDKQAVRMKFVGNFDDGLKW